MDFFPFNQMIKMSAFLNDTVRKNCDLLNSVQEFIEI